RAEPVPGHAAGAAGGGRLVGVAGLLSGPAQHDSVGGVADGGNAGADRPDPVFRLALFARRSGTGGGGSGPGHGGGGNRRASFPVVLVSRGAGTDRRGETPRG